MTKLAWLVGVLAIIWIGLNPDAVGFPLNLVFAGVIGFAIFTTGKKLLVGFATPPPEPPPPGELRKVKLNYRCEICGSEARLTVAPNEDPEPPRHCMDEMTLVVPIDD